MLSLFVLVSSSVFIFADASSAEIEHIRKDFSDSSLSELHDRVKSLREKLASSVPQDFALRKLEDSLRRSSYRIRDLNTLLSRVSSLKNKCQEFLTASSPDDSFGTAYRNFFEIRSNLTPIEDKYDEIYRNDSFDLKSSDELLLKRQFSELSRDTKACLDKLNELYLRKNQEHQEKVNHLRDHIADFEAKYSVMFELPLRESVGLEDLETAQREAEELRARAVELKVGFGSLENLAHKIDTLIPQLRKPELQMNKLQKFKDRFIDVISKHKATYASEEEAARNIEEATRLRDEYAAHNFGAISDDALKVQKDIKELEAELAAIMPDEKDAVIGDANSAEKGGKKKLQGGLLALIIVASVAVAGGAIMFLYLRTKA